MDSQIPDIAGAAAVASQLGSWPSFHDAEITRLHLERDGQSSATVRLMGALWHGETITFTFDEIVDLHLDGEDVNVQNVIAALVIESVEGATKVWFSACYGLWGHITAKRVSVRIADGSEVSPPSG